MSIYITGVASHSSLGFREDQIADHYFRPEQTYSVKSSGKEHVPVHPLHPDSEKEIKEVREGNRLYNPLDKTALLAIATSRAAVENAGWEDLDEVGVNIGSSRGATELFEEHHKQFLRDQEARLSPYVSPTTTLGNLSTWVSYDLGTKGFTMSHSITCSTALHAVINACAWLKADMAQRFIAGGSEAPLSTFTLAQMRAMGIYSRETEASFACTPFGLSGKNNMVLGEAAAVCCLEKKNDGRALAKINGIGYAVEQIAHHTSLSAEAECLQQSMKMALESAGLDQVDAIITHAPGTLLGQSSELKAIDRVFPENRPGIYSTKYLTGHSLGASGTLSLQLALLMLARNEGPQFPYETSIENKKTEFKNIMINAAGFGGNAASIIITRP